MEISPGEYPLFRQLAQFTGEELNSGKTWMITGSYQEGVQKMMRILTGQDHLSPYQLHEIGISDFKTSYATAYISYQEGIRDKHAAYYQQRFNATETDEVQTLRHYLFGTHPEISQTRHLYPLLEQFRLKHLLPEAVIKLSNGETRKASILKILLTHPQLIILEDPYAGIDQRSIPELDQLFTTLLSEKYKLLLFKDQIPPEWVTDVMEIQWPDRINRFSRDTYSFEIKPRHHKSVFNTTFDLPPTLPVQGEYAVKLNQVSVVYGDNKVLNKLSWEIRRGEKWHLTGENGAGKSTLLSLIYADHPQSYANDIEIFGRKRGQGESIWDIKEKISFCAPEVYHYFNKHQTCQEAIYSGIYLHPFKKGVRKPELEALANWLFSLFFTEAQWKEPLYKLTGSRQRLIILLRALAQNAPLVLLDEPFQGFDPGLIQQCKELTEFCCRDKTLIFVSHSSGDLPGEYKCLRLGAES